MTKLKVLKKDPLFDPRCCSYKLNGKIRNHVESLMDSSALDNNTKAVLSEIMDEDEANKNTLSYDSLTKLHQYLQRADRDYIDPFYKFCDACKCIPPKPRDNKQLEARLKVLRHGFSQAMYDSMTASIDRAVEDRINKVHDDSTGKRSQSGVYSSFGSSSTINNNVGQADEFKKLNGSMVAVFNSFLVFICTFIFCYKALEYALPSPNLTAQVLFGLGGSTVVAIAELYFLLRVV